MKKIKYLGFIWGLLFILTACESNEPQKFLAKDTFVAFEKNMAVMDENDTNPTEIPLVLAGVPGGVVVNVKVSVSTEGITNPAIEGVDFEIVNNSFTFNEGFGTQNVQIKPIDNDEFTGNKFFYLIIESVSPELMESVQNKVRVTINDDEHPLSDMFGTYLLVGTEAYETAPYAVKIAAHSSGSTNELAIDFGYENPVIASVSEIEGETVVTFYKDQNVGVTQGYETHFVYTLINGGKIYFSTSDNVIATYDGKNIIFDADNGFGFLAYKGGSPNAWFECWLPGQLRLVKQ